MKLDLLAAMELTLSAVIVVSALAIGFGDTAVRRIRLGAGLGVWFVVVVALAATEAFHYQGRIGVPGLGLAVVARIAREHRGEARFAEGHGQGNVISVTFGG